MVPRDRSEEETGQTRHFVEAKTKTRGAGLLLEMQREREGDAADDAEDIDNGG